MKKYVAICWILLISGLAIKAQEHGTSPSRSKPEPTVGEWVTLNSQDGRFSVLVPEIVPDQTETTQSPNGPYTTHLFVMKTAKGVFLVGWVDYDPSFNFGVQSELEANRDNFVKGVKGTLLNSTKITMNGHPGLEFMAESTQTVFRSRVYIVGRRPYLLIAGTYKGQVDSANVTRFFESFEVTR